MIDGVLLDLSGVVYSGEMLTPGADDALTQLESCGVPYRFVTNVSRQPATELVAKLAGLGLTIDPNTLFTAPRAARDYMRANGYRPWMLLHPDLLQEFTSIEQDSPNAVLIGDAEHGFNFDNLNQAFRLLMDGAKLLALGDNRYFRDSDGLSLDIGPFVQALQYASGCEAITLGKPSPEFFHAAVLSMGCSIDRVLMIGDDVHTDVLGALSAGLQAVLVRTGKFLPADENLLDTTDAKVFDTMADAVEWIVKMDSTGSPEIIDH